MKELSPRVRTGAKAAGLLLALAGVGVMLASSEPEASIDVPIPYIDPLSLSAFEPGPAAPADAAPRFDHETRVEQGSPLASPQSASPESCQKQEDPALDEQHIRKELLLQSGALAGKLGTPRMGQAALRQRFGVLPPGATRLVAIGDSITANAVPMNLATFETHLSPEQVLNHFASRFDERGWPWGGTNVTAEVLPFPAITATDPAERLQMSVIAMPLKSGGASVFLGLADMTIIDSPPLVDDTGALPPYPGTRVLSVRSRDAETESLTLSFQTSDAPQAVEAFYRDALVALGYREQPTDPALQPQDEAVRTVRFVSRNRAWNLTMSRHEDQTAVVALGGALEVLP